jgi:hypothetical protein
MPGLALHPVSSTRHRSGVEGGKSLLLQRSGIPALQALLRRWSSRCRARANMNAACSSPRSPDS